MRREALAAVAVRGCQLLLPAGHVAGAVLGCAGQSGAVPAAVALVAAVRLALAVRYRLAASLTASRSVSAFARHTPETAPRYALSETSNPALMKPC